MSVDTWSLRQVAGHSQFQIYWIAAIADATVTGLWTAMLLWLGTSASSPAIGAMVIAAGIVPALLLAPIGGTLTDQLGQGRTVVVTTVLRTAILLGWLVFGDSAGLAALAIAALAFNGIGGLHEPAVSTYMTTFLPPEAAPAGRSAEATGQRIAQLAGIVIGGLTLTATASGRTAVTAIAVAMSVLAVLLFTIVYSRAPDRVSASARRAVAAEPFGKRLRRGLEIIWSHPVIRRTILAQTVASGMIEGAVVAGIPFLVRDHDLPSEAFTWSLAGLFAGLFIGTVAYGSQVHRVRRMPRTGLLSFLGAAWCVILIGLLGGAQWQVMVLLSALSGAFMAAGGTCLTGWTTRQVQRDAEIRGEAVLGRFGAVIAIAKQSDRVGILLFGFLATGIGVETAIVTFGVVLLAILVWTIAPKEVRAA
ncbi:MFS transporter [Demetria terragena]|uniref:MFS transporter n=1 Tax=Demetria terragena TaxID=63959 RepID=UPI000373A197|nr:MFS transporter [Demetria terragena]